MIPASRRLVHRGANRPGRYLLSWGMTMLAGLALCGCSSSDDVAAEETDQAFFVTVRIPENLTPLQRGAKYEYPLHRALREQELGEVTGGGTQLAPVAADGTQSVAFVDIDVDLVDAERGLPALRAALKGLDPPPGTELSYERQDGEHVREQLR